MTLRSSPLRGSVSQNTSVGSRMTGSLLCATSFAALWQLWPSTSTAFSLYSLTSFSACGTSIAASQ